MERHDCDMCLSAGSVNQWGICEICGESFEEAVSFGDWSMISFTQIESHSSITGHGAPGEDIAGVGRNAA